MSKKRGSYQIFERIFLNKRHNNKNLVQCLLSKKYNVRGVAISITNSITKLLNMEDKNLNFNENFIEERKIKGRRCLIIKGYLSNSFEYCSKCGCVNDNSIIKKGNKICMIKINKISFAQLYIALLTLLLILHLKSTILEVEINFLLQFLHLYICLVNSK